MEIDETPYLIDEQYKIVKKLDNTISTYRAETMFEQDKQILLENGAIYDLSGNLIRSKYDDNEEYD